MVDVDGVRRPPHDTASFIALTGAWRPGHTRVVSPLLSVSLRPVGGIMRPPAEILAQLKDLVAVVLGSGGLARGFWHIGRVRSHETDLAVKDGVRRDFSIKRAQWFR